MLLSTCDMLLSLLRSVGNYAPKGFVRSQQRRLADVVGGQAFLVSKRPHFAGHHSPCRHRGLTLQKPGMSSSPQPQRTRTAFTLPLTPALLPVSHVHTLMSLSCWVLSTLGTQVAIALTWMPCLLICCSIMSFLPDEGHA